VRGVKNSNGHFYVFMARKQIIIRNLQLSQLICNYFRYDTRRLRHPDSIITDPYEILLRRRHFANYVNLR
jgi:hypothetical protein